MSPTKALADAMFPALAHTAEQYKNEIYPPRALPEGAQVTRSAPSPTGLLHIGVVFTSLVAERVARQSGGVFILRIEDTDKKREIENGVAHIVDGLHAFGIDFDEGPVGPGLSEIGAYGPYVQSARAAIYHSFCKELVENGLAYPCFCSEDELAALRARQEGVKALPGYHGEYAACRALTPEQALTAIRAGRPYVCRLRSPGKAGGRIRFRDVIRGEIEIDENIQDIVLLKRDGLPTYHFAHVVDDFLMGTTTVIRAEEWLPSVPIHTQLFHVLGLKPPQFAHLPQILKEDGASRRKLSKRKDPEAAVGFFVEQGYPSAAVIEYLLTLINSGYEDWRRQNRQAPYADFPVALKKMSQSGALFDLQKLSSVSADVISRLTAQQVAQAATEWARQYDPALHAALARDPAYAQAIFAIDRGGAKPRKDLEKWSDVRGFVSYLYDDLRERGRERPNVSAPDAAAILREYASVFDVSDDKDTWFGKIRALCTPHGFSPDVKAYKADPAAFKGHVGDVSAVIRTALTGRLNTPDLHAIMALLGQAECARRLDEAVCALERE